jgi:hypothetical protein
MKRNKLLCSIAVVLLVMVLCPILPAVAGGEVKLVGELNHNGKGIVDDTGKQYTVVPAEDIFRDLIKLDGQRVELTGIVYVSHGKDMITALSFKKVN